MDPTGLRTTLAVVDPDEESRTVLRYALGHDFDLVGEGGTGEAAVELAKSLRPDLMLLAMDLTLPGDVDVTRVIAEQFPEIAVVVVSEQRDFDKIRSAMTAGAKEFVAKPFEREEMVEILRRTAQRHAERRHALNRTHEIPGQGIWSFLRPSGGAGQTTMILSMAHELHRLGRNAVVLDLDALFGNASFYLGMEITPPHLGDLIETASSQSFATVPQHVKSHPTGVRLLAPPTQAVEAHGLALERVNTLITLLRGAYDYVLVDLPVGLPELFLPFLDEARYLFVCVRTDFGAMKNLQVLLGLLNALSFPSERLCPLLLRHEGDPKRLEEIRRLVEGEGVRLDRVFPEIFAQAHTAVRKAIPLTMLDPNGVFAWEIQRLLAELLELPPLPKRRGLLSGFLHTLRGG